MRRFAVPVVGLSLMLAACAQTKSEDPVAVDAKPAVASAAPSTAAPSTAAPSPAAPGLGDYDPSHNASADIKKALAAAKADGKPVLVDFGADWCPDCVVLGRLGTKPQVAPLLSSFHVVSVDVGEFDKNLDVAKGLTLNLGKSGIPALVVLDAKGKVRKVTNDGSFANARTMSASEFATFLQKWK